jgi:hypothetical protein
MTQSPGHTLATLLAAMGFTEFAFVHPEDPQRTLHRFPPGKWGEIEEELSNAAARAPGKVLHFNHGDGHVAIVGPEADLKKEFEAEIFPLRIDSGREAIYIHSVSFAGKGGVLSVSRNDLDAPVEKVSLEEAGSWVMSMRADRTHANEICE